MAFRAGAAGGQPLAAAKLIKALLRFLVNKFDLGPVHAVDTRDSILIADDGRLIATLGLSDVVVIQSAGATLVARRDQLDRLKALVEGLDAAGFGENL